jgi:hypothetical protein
MSSDIFVPIVVALIAGVAPLTAVIVTARTSKKRVAEIHVLVNSRLTQALNEIADLKKMLDAKDKVLAEQREEIKNPTS